MKGLLGFFAGAGDFAVYVAPLIITASVPISLWFGLLNHYGLPPLTVLGLAYGLAPWLTALCFFVYLWSHKSMQKRFKLRILCCGGRGGGGGGADSSYAGLVNDDNEGRLQGTRLYLSICTAVGRLPHIHTHTHTHTHTFPRHHVRCVSF